MAFALSRFQSDGLPMIENTSKQEGLSGQEGRLAPACLFTSAYFSMASGVYPRPRGKRVLKRRDQVIFFGWMSKQRIMVACLLLLSLLIAEAGCFLKTES